MLIWGCFSRYFGLEIGYFRYIWAHIFGAFNLDFKDLQIFKSSSFIKISFVFVKFSVLYIYIYSAKLPNIYIYIRPPCFPFHVYTFQDYLWCSKLGKHLIKLRNTRIYYRIFWYIRCIYIWFDFMAEIFIKSVVLDVIIHGFCVKYDVEW